MAVMTVLENLTPEHRRGNIVVTFVPLRGGTGAAADLNRFTVGLLDYRLRNWADRV